jgi:hypothetical protein
MKLEKLNFDFPEMPSLNIAEEDFRSQLKAEKQVLDLSTVMPSVCIPHCPNKETDADKCEWRGHMCFLCDMQTEA